MSACGAECHDFTPKDIKNYNACKPDSVPRLLRATIIYLGQRSHAASSCQPVCIGRATLRHIPIWHFSTQGLPPHCIATARRSLLHYIFTLTTASRGGNSLWHCLYTIFTISYPLGSVLLYAVRTFLTNKIGAMARHCSAAKLLITMI